MEKEEKELKTPKILLSEYFFRRRSPRTGFQEIFWFVYRVGPIQEKKTIIMTMITHNYHYLLNSWCVIVITMTIQQEAAIVLRLKMRKWRLKKMKHFIQCDTGTMYQN